MILTQLQSNLHQQQQLKDQISISQSNVPMGPEKQIHHQPQSLPHSQLASHLESNRMSSPIPTPGMAAGPPSSLKDSIIPTSPSPPPRKLESEPFNPALGTSNSEAADIGSSVATIYHSEIDTRSPNDVCNHTETVDSCQMDRPTSVGFELF
ncbi:unnamed protein product [Protopolystoma xenopodis]|uniref:Uncharacterized protein n=1 Tax=Protopolystoma xenopodis TaxID=117903 RepID=A0A3S5C1U1_9PLAT|nr:unnamed protein product [Protopolystoma xenopodis]